MQRLFHGKADRNPPMDRTGPCPGLALRRLEQAQREWRTLILATTRKVQRRVEGAGRGEQLRQEHVIAGLASMLATQRELSMCGNKVAIATEGYPSSERGRFGDNPVKLLPHAW
jgi:hypothetical protein